MKNTIDTQIQVDLESGPMDNKAKRYRLTGFGRRVGALGLGGSFVHELYAQNITDAGILIYDHYEHISGLKIEEVDS